MTAAATRAMREAAVLLLALMLALSGLANARAHAGHVAPADAAHLLCLPQGDGDGDAGAPHDPACDHCLAATVAPVTAGPEGGLAAPPSVPAAWPLPDQPARLAHPARPPPPTGPPVFPI